MNATVRSRLRLLATGFLAICGAGWASSYATPDALDRALVLALNPDVPHPLLDALMIGVTDYAIPFVAVLLACWGAGAEARLRGWLSPHTLFALFAVLGVVLAAIAYRVFAPIFQVAWVPVATTPLLVAGFAVAGRSFVRWDADALDRVRRVFWLTLVSVVLAEVAEAFVDELGRLRMRPFGVENADWNRALRVIPDEYVRRRGSYPSGHAVAIFALLTPAIWLARSAATRTAFAAFALLCVLSRVYLAAHYPSDAVAGAAIGFGVGTLVVFALGRAPDWRHRLAAPST
jgi:membrane-associated phospholipid phosphatase